MQIQERLHVWAAFIHVHSVVVEAIEAELQKEFGLSLSGFEVLFRLSMEPAEGLRMQDLAGFALLTKSGMTRLVDRLEEAGLVERRACPSDRRGTCAVLTRRGREELERAHPRVMGAIDGNFTSHLNAQQMDCMLDAFRAVLVAHGREKSLDACGGLPPE